MRYRIVTVVDRGRPEYEQLRTALRELRLERGLNQTELAERLGFGQKWVSNYEVGERRLDVIELADIATALETPLNDILDRAGIRHG